MAHPGLIAASVAAPIVGGMAGYYFTKEEREKAREMAQKGMAGFESLQLPTYDTSGLPAAPQFGTEAYLPDYEAVKMYRPELMEAQTTGPSALQQISTDPELRKAQMAALDRLSQVSEEGMTAEDRARLGQIQREVGRAERGSREAILQNMAQRGISGSGLELAAQLSNQQAAAERRQMEGLNVEAMAQRRALEALGQVGDLSGRIRGQDFGEEAQKAAAADAIAKFNAQQQAAAQAANVAAQNLAAQQQWQQQIGAQQEQAGILQAQQAQANQLAQQQFQNLTGQQEYMNKMKQQAFKDAYMKAAGTGGAALKYGDVLQEQAAQKAGMFAGIGKGVGQAATAYGTKGGGGAAGGAGGAGGTT